MTSMNTVILAGRLTKDPVIRRIPSGASVADIRMAINERWKGTDGEWKENTVFVDLVAWGTLAETAERHLKSGRLVLVEGSLQFEEWETQTGEKRTKLRVRISRFHFLDAPNQAPAESKELDAVHPPGEPTPESGNRKEGTTRRTPAHQEQAPDTEPSDVDTLEDLF